MNHALVFGGAGFVGSHLVEALLAQGSTVEVFDDLSTGRRAFLPSDRRVTFVRGDIRNPREFAALSRGTPEVVYHLAALHHIPTCEREPADTLAINVVGFQNVLDYVARTPARRIVFASSGAVYDETDAGALAETMPVRATNLYSSTKLTGEFLLQRVCDARGIEGISARLFNVVGPRETNAHLLPDLLAQLRQGVREVALGNLSPRRDYVHVEDVADALVAVGRAELPRPIEAFNVGSGVEFSVADVVAELGRAAGIELRVHSDPARRRPNDRMSQLADTTKLQAHTGWSARRTLHDALSQMWNELQEAA